jgi:hypothetical protein
MEPQFRPSWAQVFGAQVPPEPPHWLATPPPPQVVGAEQEPQLGVRPPQPLLWGPQAPG